MTLDLSVRMLVGDVKCYKSWSQIMGRWSHFSLPADKKYPNVW